MTQTLEKTELNPHETTWYKILKEGKSCHGGDFTWSLPTLNEDGTYTPGEWHTYEGELVLCESGFHLTNNPMKWDANIRTTFVCEVDENSFGEYNEDEQKITVSKVRLVAYFTGIIEKEDKCYFKAGLPHRDNDEDNDLPAIEYANGTKEWYKEGKKHRDNDLPAIECATGSKSWWKEGKRHRDNDLPAIEYGDCQKIWYTDGEFIKANYVANTKLNPHEVTWYKVLAEGKSCSGGNFTWSLPTLNEDETYTPGGWHTHEGELELCYSGFHLTNNPLDWMEEDCTVFVCEVEKNSFGDYDDNDKIVVSKVRLTAVFTGMIKFNGKKSYFKEGKLHSDNDLPSFVNRRGDKEWHKEGKLHRDNDKPAIEYASGSKYWYKEGKRHRDNDLPAIEYGDCQKIWYTDGEFIKANYGKH